MQNKNQGDHLDIQYIGTRKPTLEEETQRETKVEIYGRSERGHGIRGCTTEGCRGDGQIKSEMSRLEMV